MFRTIQIGLSCLQILRNPERSHTSKPQMTNLYSTLATNKCECNSEKVFFKKKDFSVALVEDYYPLNDDWGGEPS